MKKKFLVITNNDNVWLKPSWARVIKKLEEEFEFFIITVPEKKIKNKQSKNLFFDNWKKIPNI